MTKPYVYKRAEDLGISVLDAALPVLVTVTANDVVNAKKKDSKHCALARAALRLRDVSAAYFFRCTAFLEYEDKILRFALPHSVQKEIVSFDRAQVFAPGIYQLSPPPPAATAAERSRPARKKHAAALKRARRKRAVADRNELRRADLGRTIANVAARSTPEDTPEQREFDNTIATILNKNAGGRTVSGGRGPRAPEPLAPQSPRRGYVHRTQYIRDLKDPGES